MKILFEALTINKLKMNNRFVRSATMDGLADNGMVTEKEIKIYRDLGKGETGLIISHGVFPTQEGKCSPGQVSAHSDESIPSLARMAEAVHENKGKIVAQILHGGWMCRPETTGLPPVGPSALAHPRSALMVRELSSGEILKLIDDYVQATRRLIEAGFDGVQLHAAHSWILSAFLSPVTNKRDDEWGGTNEKRTALVSRICKGIRRMAGPDFPILVKLGIKDYHPEGKSISDGLQQARLLEEAGVDAIEVSEGLELDFFHHIRPDATSPYYLDECRQVKKALAIPVILVGGIRNLADMQSIIEEGTADAVSMCRPFIMDPLIVKKLKERLADNSECTSCNGCIGERRKPGELKCVIV